MTTQTELELRQAKMAQVLAHQARDVNRISAVTKTNEQRAAGGPGGLAIIDRLLAGGDATRFRDEMQSWSQSPGFQGFGGFAGQMFLNQLVKMSPDLDALSRVLVRTVAVPASERDAASKINDLASYAQSIKSGGHPAPRRSLFFLSFLWSLQSEREWPCLWVSGERAMQALGWLPSDDDLGEFYVAYRKSIIELGDPTEVGWALEWLDQRKYTGLGPWLVERTKQNALLNDRRNSGRYATDEDRARAEENARAVVGELRLLGDAFTEEISKAFGRTLKPSAPSLFWGPEHYRADGWIRWGVIGDRGGPSASFRVWITAEGMTIGLHPGWYRNGWYTEAAQLMKSAAVEGAQLLAVRLGASRVDVETAEDHEGEALYGWHYSEVSADAEWFANELVRRAAQLQPVLDHLVALAGGAPAPAIKSLQDDPLAGLVQQFVADRPYPTEQDEAHKADREMMARTLAPDEVRVMDVADLRRVYSTSRYASPGPQAVLNVTLRDATPSELMDYLGRIHFLLWGEGDDAARIDRLLDTTDMWIKGLGESGIMKLLAVVQPERYLPIYPYAGEQGKARLLKALGIEPPSPDLSAGRRQVEANDLIRNRLDRFFPNDPWGQAQFAYWLAQRPTEQSEQTESDALAALADELLLKREFISDVVELLKGKGQVVFYGPPGTGKTWVARALAKALAPDPTRRALVQFHPSTSYEDFFEGFRPEDAGGQLTYQLRKGPLALMAERAEAAPGVPHVMVIDELNRANLPKVFGELLFLLEYRDEQVRTLYRPDDAFSLPENLYFIGTMNTADRSIALVDAALRRRFHFIPFFPDEGDMEGLLERWLIKAEQPTWVADLVEMVNGELVRDLGGPDLQIGPSYFMTTDVVAKLPKIWKYNVEPLIQDQLFGQADKIREFTFDEVMKRYHKDHALVTSADGEAGA